MRSKISAITWGVGVLATTVLLIGAQRPPDQPTKWEYAMYAESPGRFEWLGAVANVHSTTVTDFFRQMGLPAGDEVSARSGRIQPVLLNHLGGQSWELVEVVVDPCETIYWFKRPR